MSKFYVVTDTKQVVSLDIAPVTNAQALENAIQLAATRRGPAPSAAIIEAGLRYPNDANGYATYGKARAMAGGCAVYDAHSYQGLAFKPAGFVV